MVIDRRKKECTITLTMSTARQILADAITQRVHVYATAETPIIDIDQISLAGWIMDFRGIMGDPMLMHAYADLFLDTFASGTPFQVCGMEVAGIPLVTAIIMKAHERGIEVNGLYLRKSRKKHGLLRAIEGSPNAHPIILVDDLINSGSSIHRAITVLEDAGLTVSAVSTILAMRPGETYSFLASRNISHRSFFTIEDFNLTVAKKKMVSSPFQTLWKFSAPRPGLQYVNPKSAPVLDAHRVYVGADNGTFYALDQATGRIAWEFRVGAIPFRKGIFSTPAIHETTVFFGAYDGNMYALDTHTGMRRWIYRDADWIGSSPALAPDIETVFIGLEFGLFSKRGGLAALNMHTGEELWAVRSISDYTHATPLYIQEARIVVVGNNNGLLLAFDARTGAYRWTFTTKGSIKQAPVYDPATGLIFVGSFDANLYAIHADDGSEAWRYATREAIFSTPLVVNSRVYVASLDKNLYCLDTKRGTRVWEFATRGRIFASPVFARDAIWIGSNDGRLYELDPESGTNRSYFQASERIVNAIAYNEKQNVFFVGTQANEVYALTDSTV